MPKWLRLLFGFLTGSKVGKVVKTAGEIVEEVETVRSQLPKPPPRPSSRYD